MKIGIDARLYNETGVGRYIRNLIYHLSVIDKDNSYLVFLGKNNIDNFKLPGTNWKKKLLDVPWHTFSEQIAVPRVLLAEKLDLMHFPYFNIPVFYPGKFIVTIHDLIIDHFGTGKASTLPSPFYNIRKLGYHLILKKGLSKAARVIAVSVATKNEIIDHYHLSQEKIEVIYEAVDKGVAKNKGIAKPLDGDYFLYVGNAYPHKNLEILLNAFEMLESQEKYENLKLVFAGRTDYFYGKLKEMVSEKRYRDKVIFWGEASDGELCGLYRHTVALVHPSLMEGFGFTPLEATLSGCPVLVSDIEIFREILGNLPCYFDPSSSSDLSDKMKKVYDEGKIEIDRSILSKYSWEETARQTLKVYESI